MSYIINYCNRNFKNYEVIIVDDGSKDKTNQIISSFKDKRVKILVSKKHMGKGYCVKKGVLNAKYDPILFTDCDLSTPIEELKKFLKYFEEGHDIIFASRNLKGSRIKVRQSLCRRIAGKVFSLLVDTLLSLGVKDTQCGFKLF